MIDLRLLRDSPHIVRDSQAARGADLTLVDAALDADARRRSALTEFERLRSEQKAMGKLVAGAHGEDKRELLARTKHLAEAVKAHSREADAAAAEAQAIMARIPNVIAGAPHGSEENYLVLRHGGGTPRDFAAEGFAARDHLDIAEGLRALDMERGAKVAGSRFYYLTGIGARLELALINAAMDQALHAGFTPTITPTLVRPEIMAGTGFLGEHAAEVYRLATDDLYLVGTSEVALAGFHSEEIIDLSDGPLRYAGFSACFRREAGSHGKDVRGAIRVHQFHKVEMFTYCAPEDAAAEHERLLAWEEQMLARIDVPYRVIDTAAGDLGTSAARKFDCEAWLPSQERYLELTSTSNCTTFQARRLNIRQRTEQGTEHVATLNGTLATTRWLVALFENHQQADGSVVVPAGLRPYLGGLEILEPVT